MGIGVYEVRTNFASPKVWSFVDWVGGKNKQEALIKAKRSFRHLTEEQKKNRIIVKKAKGKSLEEALEWYKEDKEVLE